MIGLQEGERPLNHTRSFLLRLIRRKRCENRPRRVYASINRIGVLRIDTKRIIKAAILPLCTAKRVHRGLAHRFRKLIPHGIHCKQRKRNAVRINLPREIRLGDGFYQIMPAHIAGISSRRGNRQRDTRIVA